MFLRLTTSSDTSIYISAGYILGASSELGVGVRKDETGKISGSAPFQRSLGEIKG